MHHSETSAGQGELGGQGIVAVSGASSEATGGVGSDNSSGGVTNAHGGLMQVGAGQAGSTENNTLPGICQSDLDCSATARRCLAGSCVGCLDHRDCSAGTICEGNTCSTRQVCAVDAECLAKYRCDSSRGFCVRCLVDRDCPESQSCVENRCEPFISCISPADCSANQVCDPATSRCIQCVTNANCSGSVPICRAGICLTACANDANCAAPTPKCDLTTGTCAGCVGPSDCRGDEFCNLGSCILRRCVAGESRCMSGGIESCTARGDGFENVVACPVGQSCGARLGTASCGVISAAGGSAGIGGAGGLGGSNGLAGLPQIAGYAGVAGSLQSRGGAAGAGGRNQGGSSAGGTSTGGLASGGASGSGGASSGTTNSGGTAGTIGIAGSAGSGVIQCAVGAEPCNSIPQFLGTQTVDGKDDEFCAVPSFEMSFASAEQIVEYKGSFGRSRYPEHLVARIAWSANYVHAFIRVTDPYVYPASNLDYIWGADSIEFMISANRVLSGSTADDPSALHIIAAPWKTSTKGMAASVHTRGTSGTHTALPESDYWITSDSSGYSVELKVPWPDNLRVRSTSRIAFDLAINAAVSGLGDDPNVRDAQAIYYLGTVSGSSPCGTDVSPFCDDRSWCTTILD